MASFDDFYKKFWSIFLSSPALYLRVKALQE